VATEGEPANAGGRGRGAVNNVQVNSSSERILPAVLVVVETCKGVSSCAFSLPPMDKVQTRK
jgi:hypothetical protein